MMIELLNGDRVEATYVRHLRTLTGPSAGSSNDDLDLYRLADGRSVVASSPANNGRAMPVEIDMTVDDAVFAE